jgi:hypothetical protein
MPKAQMLCPSCGRLTSVENGRYVTHANQPGRGWCPSVGMTIEGARAMEARKRSGGARPAVGSGGRP